MLLFPGHRLWSPGVLLVALGLTVLLLICLGAAAARLQRVDEAVDYVMHRWPLGFGPNLAAQLRAAVRGTGTTE